MLSQADAATKPTSAVSCERGQQVRAQVPTPKRNTHDLRRRTCFGRCCREGASGGAPFPSINSAARATRNSPDEVLQHVPTSNRPRQLQARWPLRQSSLAILHGIIILGIGVVHSDRRVARDDLIANPVPKARMRHAPGHGGTGANSFV